MKKILTILSIFIFCFIFTGCKEKSNSETIDELDFRALDYVNLYNYDSYKIKTEPYTLTKDELNSIIELDMTSHNQFIPITERDIPENDDILFLNIKAKNAENIILESERYFYQVGCGAFSEEFDNRLKSTPRNEVISFDIEFDKDFENELVAGKRIDFTVCITKINREIKITDEYIILDYYDCTSIDEVYTMLNKESIKQAVFDEIYSNICINSNVNGIPEVLKKSLPLTNNQYKNDEWIFEYILLKAICEKEKITFDNSDFINERNTLAKENNMSVSDVERLLNRYSICYYMMYSAVYNIFTSRYCQ